MRVLIACEESQEVTNAFCDKGHFFNSCDLQDCSGGHPIRHIKDDIFHELSRRVHVYDFGGGHPPCDFLANSGIGWLVRKKPRPGFIWNEKINRFYNPARWEQMEDAALFFKSLYANIETIGKGYIENPIMHKYAIDIIGIKPNQVIQPYMFGHPESKATCLWLIGLPKLRETNNVKHIWLSLPKKEGQRLHYLPPSINRKKIRSKTFPGIALAMAEQWG